MALNSIAQIFLRFGMSNLDKKLSLSMAVIFHLITNFYVFFGATLYGMSFIVWLYVLSKAKVSYAYPFISLSYVIVAVLALLMLGEKIPLNAWLGIILIVIGVSFVGINLVS